MSQNILLNILQHLKVWNNFLAPKPPLTSPTGKHWEGEYNLPSPRQDWGAKNRLCLEDSNWIPCVSIKVSKGINGLTYHPLGQGACGFIYPGTQSLEASMVGENVPVLMYTFLCPKQSSHPWWSYLRHSLSNFITINQTAYQHKSLKGYLPNLFSNYTH